MNPFEAYNLKRLAENLKAAKIVHQHQFRYLMEQEAKHMVYMLFELHHGDLHKIKEALRADSELIKGLGLESTVNDEYQRQSAKRHIYDSESHRSFWAFIFKCITNHNRKLTT